MLVLASSTPSFALREAGGKGYNLYLMSQMGLPIPEWVVLGRRCFEQFLEQSGCSSKIEAEIAAFSKEGQSALVTSRKIAGLIEDAPLPIEVRGLLDEAYRKVGFGTISVRSSASDEDSSQHSFAGQLSSFLYVEGVDDVQRFVKACWASGFTERGLVYRKENNLPLSGIRVAVVLQRMIDAEKSGVVFTCDPVDETIDRFLVTAVYGVGEGLVSGALEADSYWLKADGFEVTRRKVAQKESAFKRLRSGECQTVLLETCQRQEPVLDDTELREIHRLSTRLLEAYNTPQDVEFAIAKGRVYVLQTRPVTTLKSNLLGYLNLWDNSNIVESYGGLTSPLSFTFALRNYKHVYNQFCEVLNVPREVVKDMDDYLGTMLGCLNGRVYYNLYNWYKLVGILPGFDANREFMETMMGVSEALSGEVATRIRPHPSWDTWRGKWRKLKTGVSFVWYHFTIQHVVEQFLADFRSDYLRYRNRDYARMRGDQIMRVYVEMERNMLGRWKAPIINDFLCMVHFGLLKKLTAKWLAEQDATIQNDLLAGEGHLESAEPTKVLIGMAGWVSKNPELKKLLEETPAPDSLERLSQSEHKEFLAQVQGYIDRFGFRCMNEMKLEEIDLYSDPTYLFLCLKNYLRAGTTDLRTLEEREKALRASAEKKVFSHLKGLRKMIYAWSLRNARKAVRNRENTRFARTRIYGVARTQFQAMGEDFARRGALESPRDIFWLELQEVFGAFQGTLTTYDFKGIVALRKASYACFEDEEPSVRFQTRGPVYWGNSMHPPDKGAPRLSLAKDPTADLQGLPCCPGVVEGVVRVITSPKDNLELNGEILVTLRTDPGWVPLYPSVSGLLVERGSLLSHSAIVAREMGLPAIVSVPNLTKTLKSGMRIRMDGKSGTVTILSAS